jgi:hypothetical protein
MSTVGYINLYPFTAPRKSSQNNPSSLVLIKCFLTLPRVWSGLWCLTLPRVWSGLWCIASRPTPSSLNVWKLFCSHVWPSGAFWWLDIRPRLAR